MKVKKKVKTHQRQHIDGNSEFDIDYYQGTSRMRVLGGWIYHTVILTSQGVAVSSVLVPDSKTRAGGR
jgi:hypothetical protein